VVETAPRTGALSRVESTSAASEATSWELSARRVCGRRVGLGSRRRVLVSFPPAPRSVSPLSHRTLAALARWGSQTRSQRRQAPGHTRRRRAIVSTARSLLRPSPSHLLLRRGSALLSSRSRVRIPPGRTAKAKSVPETTVGHTIDLCLGRGGEQRGQESLLGRGECPGGTGRLSSRRVNYHVHATLASSKWQALAATNRPTEGAIVSMTAARAPTRRSTRWAIVA
jgi:hypothetical protein